ncbi:hypothetical protein CPB83DRAFT_845118 [Crepidotus variabilis]|uniref:Uncharacterized protein n=1 Tax=Crepidotus variabilis TaxID=179855 RepID=A0A9P6EP29_9AGAR|nr:hypothetical protein CPB83DRAFT_845118 [Crepidotus variabilis]
MSLVQKHELSVRLDKGSNMQMPIVYVVPPEEDQSPPWCFFDAQNPALSRVIERPETPEIAVVAYGSSSIDAVVMGAPSSNTSVLEALADEHYDQGEDTESEYDNEPDQVSSGPKRSARDAANDSDVVEVVKVRRRDSKGQVADSARHQASQPVRTKTLTSRASRAFKSFKGTLKSKPRTNEVSSASSSRSSTQNETDFLEQVPQGALPRSQTPTATSRGPRIFSGLFNPPPLNQRTSVSNFEEQPPASPTYPTTTHTSESSASTSNTNHLPHRGSLYDPALQDAVRLQAASPAFTTASRKSFRRFSKLNLNRLFTFGGNTPPSHPIDPSPIAVEEPETEPTTPTLRSVASTPFSSNSSNSGPETPTSAEYQMPIRRSSASGKEERPMSPASPTHQPTEIPVFDTLDTMFESNNGLNLGLGLGIDLDSAVTSSPRHPSSRQAPPAPRRSSSSSMWDAITPKRLSKSSGRQPSPVEDDEDEDGFKSLDIHLDSLHFDDLSFDADRFTFN